MRNARRTVVGTAALVAGLVAGLAGPGHAAWSDVRTSTGGAFSAATVPPPVLSCSASNPLGGPKTVTVTWPVVTTPTTLTYAATEPDAGTPFEVTSAGGSSSVTLTGSTVAGLLDTLGGILGGSPSTMRVQVVAALPDTGWVSTAASRAIRRDLLGNLVCA